MAYGIRHRRYDIGIGSIGCIINEMYAMLYCSVRGVAIRV